MYIKNIKLLHYRNFEQLIQDEGLKLGKKVTLLIGKNGSGKTNMITALKQSLSFIFSKNKKILHSDFIADTIQAVKSFETTDATRRIVDGKQTQSGLWPIVITTLIDLGEECLDVVFERESLSTGIKESYSKSSVKFWEKYRDLGDLPVLAFYSDSFPHAKATIGKKIQDLLNSEFGISKPAGYYNWDDPRDCCNVWQQYFIMQWKNYMYGLEDNKEYLEAIKDCLCSFSQPLENAAENADFVIEDVKVVARGKKEVLILRFQNGLESDFDTLPTGYRRVFSIVFDLANRAFLLNNNCNPDGIAFIDEVDLHLHPSIAQEIMERLTSTFKRIQFIVSTHSPLVLSNFKQHGEENIVYNLTRPNIYTTEIRKIDYSYGIDYNSLLVDLMGTKIRNSMLRQLVESYLYWKESEDDELMESTLKEIVDLVGEESKIVKELKK